jgi:site-specific recombinase XerD
MKNKLKDPELFKAIKIFLTSYLPVVKRKSPHTITAYKDAINMYFHFLNKTFGIGLKDVSTKDLSQAKIVSFLEWLENTRNNEATTINQRLSHIKGFCRYLKKNDVLSFVSYEEICEISEVKDTRVLDFVWLTIDDIKHIFEQLDSNKKTGIRDKFFLALLYESGCRDEEILHLKVKDFIINKNGEPDVHIFGKGNKHRCTPLSKDIVPYFNEYRKLYHPNIENEQDDLMFFTMRNGIKAHMSADNVQRFMKEYETKAKATRPDIPHLHPHLWRRTRAMHLYIAGVPLPLVSEWLGHSHEETTRIYARATDEMKRQAQRKLEENENSVFKDDIAFKYADDEETLKRLSGLK